MLLEWKATIDFDTVFNSGTEIQFYFWYFDILYTPQMVLVQINILIGRF